MRVISGEARGRRLKTPSNARIRPTGDRVKETLFDVIGEKVRGARVLDLFAGTGNLGIEALSRGAHLVLFVDMAKGAVAIIRENLTRTQLMQRGQIWRMDVFVAISMLKKEEHLFDIVFLDPPYEYPYTERALRALHRAHLFAPGGIMVVEHHKKDVLLQRVIDLEKRDERRFGDTVLTFYEQRVEP